MYFVPADQDIAVMTERAVEAVGPGLQDHLVYKVGIDEERDVELVLPTREMQSGLALRVEQPVWSPSTAIRILSKMRPASLEYVAARAYA